MNRKHPGQPGAYVYVMKAENGALKIGSSTNPEERVKDVREEGFEKPKLIHKHLIDGNAYVVECVTHNLVIGKRIRGEWFSVSVDEAINAIERADVMVSESGVESFAEWISLQKSKGDRTWRHLRGKRIPITIRLKIGFLEEINRFSKRNGMTKTEVIERGAYLLIEEIEKLREINRDSVA